MTTSARLLLALLLLPLSAEAQKFLPGKLPDASRDSFDIVYQGQAIGAFTISVNRSGDNITMVGEARLPRVLRPDELRGGTFTMRVRLPQGYVLEPHTHARDERVTVLDGSVHIGFGARAGATEKAAARRYVAGSYYVNPAGVAHFVFTTEPAVMQITTTGPWTLEYVAQP